MESKPSHEIEPVAQDNEQFGSRDRRDIGKNPLPDPVLSFKDRKLNYQNACLILNQAAFSNNWRVAEPILKKDLSFVRENVSYFGTILHIAALARSTRFVQELMKLTKADDLEVKNKFGETAFFFMQERNNNLPNIPCDDGRLPITGAAIYGFKAMVSYLFDVTSFDVIQKEHRLDLLRHTVHSESYDVALNIFNKDKELGSKMLQLGNSEILGMLSISSLECRGNLKKFRVLPERYVQKKLVGLLLEKLWTECKRSDEDELLELVKRESLLHSAAQAGNVGFLAVVIRNHPDLIWTLMNHKKQTIFHTAVIYREEKVFSLLHQMGGIENLAIAEKIMLPSFLRVSGAEVEKIAPPYLRRVTNGDGKTPKELFREEHKVLLKEGERWMKDTANSCMIVTTLIATMAFAVGFTAPGGYNGNNGIPILLELNGFKVFIISDAVALFSSILLFGLIMLFVSIVSMLLAFAATFFLVYSNHMGWEPKLIIACAAVPLALFGCLQYKLWFDLLKSVQVSF
ncbi:hypothetical protein R3W88_005142 [Solanum pinnatisectum]|uniref:PGG domain-containing protein n=1 Tax=Solanum pinnatisectum TaxID=50273 RepID=A0AAV9KDG7_9SOLN|nr:hypothetical protein R3W88_005142 [Solanum pinnatisectum]